MCWWGAELGQLIFTAQIVLRSIWHHEEEEFFEERWSSSHSLPTAQGAIWASMVGWWPIASVWLDIDIHIYTFVIAIIHFLFSVLVNSFISTHEYYLLFFFFFFPTLTHCTWNGGVSKWLCGAQPPAGWNHKRSRDWDTGEQSHWKGFGGFGQQQVEQESAVCPGSQQGQL